MNRKLCGQKIKPTFLKGGYKNHSVIKCHTYVLNHSLLPAPVQQRSQGHAPEKSSEYWRNTTTIPMTLFLVRDQVAAAVAQKALPFAHPATPPPAMDSPTKHTHSATKKISSPATKRSLDQMHSPPTKSVVYRSGTLSLDHDDDGVFDLQLPKGSCIRVTIPGGLEMKFNTAK